MLGFLIIMIHHVLQLVHSLQQSITVTMNRRNKGACSRHRYNWYITELNNLPYESYQLVPKSSQEANIVILRCQYILRTLSPTATNAKNRNQTCSQMTSYKSPGSSLKSQVTTIHFMCSRNNVESDV